MLDAFNQSKVNSGQLFVRQPHAIIQLVEGPPPPRRIISSAIESSSAGSSCSSYPSTSDSSEEDCSSYCSSYVTPERSSSRDEGYSQTDDTFDIRMHRIQTWRDSACKALAESHPSPLKRKMTQHQTDDDTMSHTSKRSRSRDGASAARISGHPCTACDTPFPSRQSLRQHGRMPQAPEACRIAVDYNFE
ncbi:hypothetical protein BJ138DRAFT_1136832 [Hygrophoropsis aurantiaca]|uniref:Uncharacterized protein n=1 Tax=Hygrophoropsis aurantiaca TaxID=72124 RepID=A0ACB8A712_9AGAM|nr:hypothetical protein BJ138DRAFT_1136832 [Hygrophoropsis aurantiaca]